MTSVWKKVCKTLFLPVMSNTLLVSCFLSPTGRYCLCNANFATNNNAEGVKPLYLLERSEKFALSSEQLIIEFCSAANSYDL